MLSVELSGEVCIKAAAVISWDLAMSPNVVTGKPHTDWFALRRNPPLVNIPQRVLLFC